MKLRMAHAIPRTQATMITAMVVEKSNIPEHSASVGSAAKTVLNYIR